MILVDWQIREWAENSGLCPCEPVMINPASVDLRVGVGWIDIEYPNIKNPDVEFTVYKITLRTLLQNAIVDGLYKLFHDRDLLRYRRPTAVLLTTLETVTLPKNMVAQIKLKSTPTREGLGHPIADWVDNAFSGQLTLMVTANRTIKLELGYRICQLVLHTTKTPKLSYDEVGHYQNQSGATPSWRLQKE